jgi:hypothetical protein
MIPIHDTLAFVMLDRAKRRCARPVAVAQTVLDQAKLVFLRDLHEHIFKLCPPEFVEFGKSSASKQASKQLSVRSIYLSI